MSNRNIEDQTSDSMIEMEPPKGIEREVLGKWTVFLRNLGGILSVMAVCCTALFNSYTIYISVTDKGEWPSETSMFIMMVGPILCAWAFMNVNKTISTIMQFKPLASRIRNRLATAIATEDSGMKQQDKDNTPPNP